VTGRCAWILTNGYVQPLSTHPSAHDCTDQERAWVRRCLPAVARCLGDVRFWGGCGHLRHPPRRRTVPPSRRSHGTFTSRVFLTNDRPLGLTFILQQSALYWYDLTESVRRPYLCARSGQHVPRWVFKEARARSGSRGGQPHPP
jgi:hypothetical protein